MIKQLLEEVRAAPLDEASRNRLRDIHASSIRELEQGLAPELREELERITLPFNEDQTPDRRRAADRPGAAGRLAGGRVPRHPDGAVRPADGRPRPARGDAPPRAARRSGHRRAARLPPRRRPVPLTADGGHPAGEPRPPRLPGVTAATGALRPEPRCRPWRNRDHRHAHHPATRPGRTAWPSLARHRHRGHRLRGPVRRHRPRPGRHRVALGVAARRIPARAGHGRHRHRRVAIVIAIANMVIAYDVLT